MAIAAPFNFIRLNACLITSTLFIALLLCICSLYSTAQDCNTRDTAFTLTHPSTSDNGIYILKVRLRFPAFGDCNYAGCFAEQVLCKVVSSSDPKFRGRYISVLFMETGMPWFTSQVYTVVIQPTDKDKISYSGSWQRDTCIKKIYLARTVVPTKVKSYEPFFNEENVVNFFGPMPTRRRLIKSNFRGITIIK